MRHKAWVLIACVVPLLLILLLPLFGIGAGVTLTLLHIAVFGIHLVWTRHHQETPHNDPAIKHPRLHSASPWRIGFAVGSTFGLIYLACAIVMATVPREVAIRFYNNLTHGIDVSTLIVWDVPLWHVPLGLIQIIVIGWLIGSTATALYNLTAGPVVHTAQRTHQVSDSR